MLVTVKALVAVLKPSILQITLPSMASKLSSHTVPQTPWCLTSTRPRDLPGTRRTLTVARRVTGWCEGSKGSSETTSNTQLQHAFDQSSADLRSWLPLSPFGPGGPAGPAGSKTETGKYLVKSAVYLKPGSLENSRRIFWTRKTPDEFRKIKVWSTFSSVETGKSRWSWGDKRRSTVMFPSQTQNRNVCVCGLTVIGQFRCVESFSYCCCLAAAGATWSRGGVYVVTRWETEATFQTWFSWEHWDVSIGLGMNQSKRLSSRTVLQPVICRNLLLLVLQLTCWSWRTRKTHLSFLTRNTMKTWRSWWRTSQHVNHRVSCTTVPSCSLFLGLTSTSCVAFVSRSTCDQEKSEGVRSCQNSKWFIQSGPHITLDPRLSFLALCSWSLISKGSWGSRRSRWTWKLHNQSDDYQQLFVFQFSNCRSRHVVKVQSQQNFMQRAEVRGGRGSDPFHNEQVYFSTRKWNLLLSGSISFRMSCWQEGSSSVWRTRRNKSDFFFFRRNSEFRTKKEKILKKESQNQTDVTQNCIKFYDHFFSDSSVMWRKVRILSSRDFSWNSQGNINSNSSRFLSNGNQKFWPKTETQKVTPYIYSHKLILSHLHSSISAWVLVQALVLEYLSTSSQSS